MAPLNDAMITVVREYVGLANQLFSLKTNRDNLITRLKDYFAGKSFKDSANVEELKAYIRAAKGVELIWARGSLLYRQPKDTPAKVKDWKEREDIRSSVNSQAKEMIKRITGLNLGTKFINGFDAFDETEPAPSNSSSSSSSSSSSTPAPPNEPRPKRTLQPAKKNSSGGKKSSKKKARRNPYDGLLQISDFRSITTSVLVRKHGDLVEEAQAAANTLAAALGKLGSATAEYFVDGKDENNVAIRFMAVRPHIIENIKFRKSKIAYLLEDANDETADDEESA